MTVAPKKAGARKVSAKRAPAKKTESVDSEAKTVNVFEELAAKTAPPKAISPYPQGVAIWTYQPNDKASSPIVLPLNGFQAGDKLWHFDLAQLPILAQTWKWMERANVPKPIQRQCQFLDDAEYFAMFNQWFDAMKAQQAPKGSVTAGK